MSALPPNDPHGYIKGTTVAVAFALGILVGGLLSIITPAIYLGGTHV